MPLSTELLPKHIIQSRNMGKIVAQTVVCVVHHRRSNINVQLKEIFASTVTSLTILLRFVEVVLPPQKRQFI